MPIQPLHAERDRFINADGSEYRWKGHIDFMAFFRSLNGQSLNDIVLPKYVVGSRSVTTLMMAHYIEHQDPDSYGWRMFGHIKPFAQALRDLDMYWRPIVFADVQAFGWSQQKQQNFLDNLAREFDGEWNVLPSLGNEFQKNGLNPGAFARPNTSNLWSRGSSLSDTAPYRPGWDYVEWHPRRDWPKVLWGCDDGWYVKEGIDGEGHMLDYPKPGIVGEPIGFWDKDVPGRRSQDPNLARVIGGTSIYNMRGADFMSEEGLRCDPWTPRTTECAIRFFTAIDQQ